jgi:hypothetical protein
MCTLRESVSSIKYVITIQCDFALEPPRIELCEFWIHSNQPSELRYIKENYSR